MEKGTKPLRKGEDYKGMEGRGREWNKEAGSCREKNKNGKVKNLFWKRLQRIREDGRRNSIFHRSFSSLHPFRRCPVTPLEWGKVSFIWGMYMASANSVENSG